MTSSVTRSAAWSTCTHPQHHTGNTSGDSSRVQRANPTQGCCSATSRTGQHSLVTG
jgi:hypothetical protein